MYEWADARFEAAGLAQYEISNWARPGHECRHNLQYWRGLPYLGLGAGAHGYIQGQRYSNVLRIKTYIDRLRPLSPDASFETNLRFPFSPAAINRHSQSGQDEQSEYMMTGLRLTREGVSLPAFRSRFGRELTEVYSKEIGELTRVGLVEITTITASDALEAVDVLRLTRRGRLLGNQVFMRFID
jgi:oxygen-independent coproporphyrinogen-3 oxidase